MRATGRLFAGNERVAEWSERVSNAVWLVKGNRSILFGLGLSFAVYLIAYVGYLVSPYNPLRYGDVPRNLAPSLEYLLGTDPWGRDIYAGMYGHHSLHTNRNLCWAHSLHGRSSHSSSWRLLRRYN